MGLLGKLFGKTRQRRTTRAVRKTYVLSKAAARRLMEESKVITERARRMGAKKPSAADRALKASPGHVMLVRGARYRWTLQFSRARGGKLTDAQIDQLIASTKADSDTRKGSLRVHKRNPLVLSYTSASGQPVTTEAPIGSSRPVQALPGVRETIVRVVEV